MFNIQYSTLNAQFDLDTKFLPHLMCRKYIFIIFPFRIGDQNERLAMKKIVYLLLFIFSISFSKAQLLSWAPSFPEENDATTDIVITANATRGNQGLLNYTPVTDVYVHIGVITNLSANSADWKYVKFTWGTTDIQAQCINAGSNQWQYTITGSLRSYFGITNASEHIQKIAILFRNGNGSKKLANADGSDMFIPVYDNAIIAVRFTDPPIQPLFIPSLNL